MKVTKSTTLRTISRKVLDWHNCCLFFFFLRSCSIHDPAMLCMGRSNDRQRTSYDKHSVDDRTMRIGGPSVLIKKLC